MTEPRVRRARALIAWWDGEEFVVENYLTGQQSRVSPLIGHLLAGLDVPGDPAAIAAELAELPDSQGILAELLRHGLLLEEGTASERRDRRLDERWSWERDARFFHHSSRRIEFQDRETQERRMHERARDEPPPPPYKTAGKVTVELPDTLDRAADSREPASDIWSTLANRRTRRDFDRRPLDRATVARLLQWVWGRTREIEDSGIGRYILKTTPSGGARHPIEVYPVIQRVDGIEAGVYHYSVENHGLVQLAPAIDDRRLVELCGGQPWIENAAVVFFLTAVVERSMWKYPQSHAYRVLHLDAGHLGQTFHLVATALGLAPLTFGALDAAAVESLLGLDGIDEFVLYAAAVGRCPTRSEPDTTQPPG